MADNDLMKVPSDAFLSEPRQRSSFDGARDYASHASTAGTPGVETDVSQPPSPRLGSRASSFSQGLNALREEEWEEYPALDRVTFFDLLENIALPKQLEKWQSALAAQTGKVMKSQRDRFTSSSRSAKDRVVDEWRRRLPTPDEQLDKYRKRVRRSVERLGRRWNDTMAVTLREKISFIAGVLNIFLSGYLIGALPEYFYYWYTLQICYFMPIRYYTYRKRGYHYFLADLCYFVNALLLLSVWAFPNSKRLLISTYCLAYGNNAVAIAMWRNSMVFHSLDKVTSLFIHIMPPVTLHCMVHLTNPAMQATRFPAIHTIRFSDPASPEHYSLPGMMLWATVPYAIWQLSYHFLITVRRRDAIAAGRPTSFTWLRRSYADSFLGRRVLALPQNLQEPGFMVIQYGYALLTMIPCPLWFWYRWASATFLLVVFIWSVYNGATFYIDVFGKRFERELDALKKDVARWQSSPAGALGMNGPQPPLDGNATTPLPPPALSTGDAEGEGETDHSDKGPDDSHRRRSDRSDGSLEVPRDLLVGADADTDGMNESMQTLRARKPG